MMIFFILSAVELHAVPPTKNVRLGKRKMSWLFLAFFDEKKLFQKNNSLQIQFDSRLLRARTAHRL